MLNDHSRRTIGKCAVDLYEAGNRRESLDLLRQLAEASERHADIGVLPGWRETVRDGARRMKLPIPPVVKKYGNV